MTRTDMNLRGSHEQTVPSSEALQSSGCSVVDWQWSRRESDRERIGSITADGLKVRDPVISRAVEAKVVKTLAVGVVVLVAGVGELVIIVGVLSRTLIPEHGINGHWRAVRIDTHVGHVA